MTKDNNKKKKDNQAKNQLNNQAFEKNAEQGKHQYSKDTDHI
ncbi:DUF3941 domain-containing protein [Halalkalibacterium ligniniphilum]|nr:DUF3941 domain-containing protein [Halalkalibacterium ligniniphilum]